MVNTIKESIERHGWFVALFDSTPYLTSFAYTIGLSEHFHHSELMIFGLPVDEMHGVLNEAAGYISEGKALEFDRGYEFDGIPVRVIEVDPSYSRDYFGYVLEYYGKPVGFLQLVWPDQDHRFPWDESSGWELPSRQQPLLNADPGFKFLEPRDLGVFTTRQHLELGKPILSVLHDEDGDWQFLTGDQMPEDARIVSLECMVAGDPSLNELFNLDYGEWAERRSVREGWVRGKD